MNTIKYLVYSGDGTDNLLAWFDEEVEAIIFAKENIDEQPRVEKAECDLAEDGFLNEIVSSETIWSYLDYTVNDSDQEFSENSSDEFDTDFPESDIIDCNSSDDECYSDEAWKLPDTSIKEAVDALEENESEVECKCCFELFPKEECVKTEKGYLCKKCNQEANSHQGTGLDLIDKDPFSLDYEDPRDLEETEKPEIKEKPIDANEMRKHEKAIEENKLDESQSQEIGSTYKKLSKLYNVDLEELVYGDDGFMKSCYPKGFPDFAGDVIYSDKYWAEFEKWLKETKGIVLDDKGNKDLSKVSMKEHINDRPADIESDQVLHGTDNAVVDCDVAKVIAHSEDEKPLDCKMKKPALEEPLAGEKVDIKINEDLSADEIKDLDKEIKTLKEELKVITDFDDYKPWSGAVDTYELIKDAGKLDELESYLEDCYPDGATTTQINDTLWFDSKNILSYLGLGDTEDSEDFDESLNEAKKDDDLPVDPEAAKLEVHNNLNNLVADEISTINEYDEAKAEILDAPIEHKDTIINTLEHIKDEEKEHIDELIDATNEIPFGKSKSPIAEKPLEQDFPEVEEDLKEAKAKPEGDKEKSYNDGLKLAKAYDKPVIYGYTNKSYGGKFFALDKPIVCNNVSDETKKFKAQYKSCGTVYVAYPDKDSVKSRKLSEDLDNQEIFTPEEQQKYNCDEYGNSNFNFDTLHHCGWCGECFPESEMKHEVDFGWVCSSCEDMLKYLGGPLTFIENKKLKK